MFSKIDNLIKEIYDLEKHPELIDTLYDKLWKKLRETIYKLESFSAANTGLKKTSIFVYNNMFIWDTTNNIVSDRKIYSPYKSNITTLRKLYNKYIGEINLIKKNKTLLKNAKLFIIFTEVLVNMLYLYGWDIDRMINDKFDFFNICCTVYFNDIEKFLSINLEKIGNNNKINLISEKINKELKKILLKNKKYFQNL